MIYIITIIMIIILIIIIIIIMIILITHTLSILLLASPPGEGLSKGGGSVAQEVDRPPAACRRMPIFAGVLAEDALGLVERGWPPAEARIITLLCYCLSESSPEAPPWMFPILRRYGYGFFDNQYVSSPHVSILCEGLPLLLAPVEQRSDLLLQSCCRRS